MYSEYSVVRHPVGQPAFTLIELLVVIALIGILSFADGRVERWKWKWPKQFKKKQSYWKRAENPADLSDLRHLQQAILPVPNFRAQP